MGNEQSAPAPRGRRNKLSKPRTNTNISNSKSPISLSGQNSQLDVGFSNSRSSAMSLPIEVGGSEAGERRSEEPQRKRMSLFRSKSSQAKVHQLEINNAVNIEYLEPADRWTERNPMVDPRDQRYSAPTKPMQTIQRPPPPRTTRMTLQHVPYSQHYTRLSLVPEAPSPQPELYPQRRNSILPDRTNSMRPTSDASTSERRNSMLQYRGNSMPAASEQSIPGRRNSLLPERRNSLQPTPESPRKERRQSLRQYEEDNPPKLSEPLTTRTNSDTALYAPMRRRSLLQHGVATRNSWVENESKESTPTPVAPQVDMNYYYNPAKPTSSPLSSLANLGTPQRGENEPGPRVATPNDLDYGHIGAYKLGSLRITNGAASPVPSLDGPDYMTAGEALKSAETQRYALPPRSNTIAVLPEAAKPWITRSESPLRQEYVETQKVKPLETLTIETHLPLPEFSLFRFNDSDSPTRSLELARGYQEELALSPFSFDNSPLQSPQLQATSKHMAVEDDLFEPEPETPEVSQFPVRKSVDSGYREETSTPIEAKKVLKGSRDFAPKPLAKADSGYSSNVSLRSFKSNPPPVLPPKVAPPTPPKPVTMEPVSRVASSAYSISSLPSMKSDITIRAKGSLPSLPVEEQMPAQPYRQAPPVPPKYSSRDFSDKEVLIPSLPPKSPEQTWAAQAKPNVLMKSHKHTRSQSIPPASRLAMEERQRNNSTPASDISSSSTSSGTTSRWRRRSRSRSTSQSMAPPEPVYTVQASPTPSEGFSIPPVSVAAQQRLEQRVEAFPVACFPNTERGNPAIRRSTSKETLKTIFSVGSAEWREELTYQRLHGSLPAVPTEATIPESLTPEAGFNRRNTYQAPLPQAPPFPRKPMLIRQSTQPAPRPNPGLQQKMRQDFVTEITSLDNISSSLGRSPYDAAMSASPDSKSKQQARAKSMTAQFEADAAARYAQARNVSQTSQYSQQSLQRATSYDSITNANPWSGGSSSRASSRECPPQAHTNRTSILNPRRSDPNLREQEDRTHSFVSLGRMRGTPPVSMQTQRKSSNHISPRNSPQAQQDSRFAAPPPNRTPPHPPPQQFSRADSEEKQVYDPWENQKDFWASRKQDALLQTRKSMELQSRKSMELRRPSSTQPTYHHEPIPRAASARPDYTRPNPISHPVSTRTSMEFHPQAVQSRKSAEQSRPWKPTPTPSARASFDLEHQQPQLPRLSAHGPWIPRKPQPLPREEEGYSHTYGAQTPYMPDARRGYGMEGEGEYYESPAQEYEADERRRGMRAVSGSSTTTRDMLVLERLGCEFGLGGVGGSGVGVGVGGTRVC